jgi:hypothetical protein
MATETPKLTPCRPIAGADPRLSIRRRLLGHAYPQNGNVHNPTPRYVFELLVDGQMVDSDTRERVLRDAAKTNGATYIAEIDARQAGA